MFCFPLPPCFLLTNHTIPFIILGYSAHYLSPMARVKCVAFHTSMIGLPLLSGHKTFALDTFQQLVYTATLCIYNQQISRASELLRSDTILREYKVLYLIKFLSICIPYLELVDQVLKSTHYQTQVYISNSHFHRVLTQGISSCNYLVCGRSRKKSIAKSISPNLSIYNYTPVQIVCQPPTITTHSICSRG